MVGETFLQWTQVLHRLHGAALSSQSDHRMFTSAVQVDVILVCRVYGR